MFRERFKNRKFVTVNVKAKAFTAILSILLLTGLTAGIQVQPEKAAAMESNNIEIGEREQVSTLDRIFQSLNFLSVIDAPENADPGSTIEFTSEVDVQETFNLEGSVNVVEIYKCQDYSCDDGELVEADSTFNEFDFVVEEGTSHTWTTSYTVPSEEGYYAATSYISDGEGTVYTDTPEHIFTVGTVPDEEEGEDGDGGEQVQEPDVVQNSKPVLSYEEGTATVQVSFRNNGGPMQQEDIVEMQVRPSGQGPLSIGTLSFGETQRVCDEQNPMAVHKSFQLDAGEVATTTLQVDNIDESGSYDVFLLTRDACFPDNEKVDPYFNSIRAGTIDFESGEGVVGDVNNNLVLIGILGLFIVVIGGVIWAVN